MKLLKDVRVSCTEEFAKKFDIPYKRDWDKPIGDKNEITGLLNEKYPPEQYFFLVDYEPNNLGSFHIRIWDRDDETIREAVIINQEAIGRLVDLIESNANIIGILTEGFNHIQTYLINKNNK